MKIKELIEILQQNDMESEVRVYDPDTEQWKSGGFIIYHADHKYEYETRVRTKRD